MDNKTIYLHVGTTKTGTTSIQNFLRNNEAVLNHKGVASFTPLVMGDASDPRRMQTLIEVLRQKKYKRPRDLKNNQWVKDFFKCLRKTPQEKIILSQEVLWNAIIIARKKPNFEWFVKRIQRIAKVQIIVYLRRQDLYLMSVYQQNLKGGRIKGLTCREWLNLKDNKMVKKAARYQGQLEYIISLVGKENVIVKAFEQGQFVEGSLLIDFMDSLGMKLTEDYKPLSKRKNVGLSPFLAEIIRSLSFFYEDQKSIQPIKQLRNNQSESYNHKSTEHEFLSPKERLQLMKNYEQENEWVAREMMGRRDGILFYDPLPADNALWEQYRLQEEQVRNFFVGGKFLNSETRQRMLEQVLSVQRGEMQKARQ